MNDMDLIQTINSLTSLRGVPHSVVPSDDGNRHTFVEVVGKALTPISPPMKSRAELCRWAQVFVAGWESCLAHQASESLPNHIPVTGGKMTDKKG